MKKPVCKDISKEQLEALAKELVMTICPDTYEKVVVCAKPPGKYEQRREYDSYLTAARSSIVRFEKYRLVNKQLWNPEMNKLGDSDPELWQYLIKLKKAENIVAALKESQS